MEFLAAAILGIEVAQELQEFLMPVLRVRTQELSKK